MGLTTNAGNMKVNVNGGERMRITSMGNVSCTGSIGCVGVSANGGMLIGTNLGIQNTTPWEPLNIGNCSVANSNGAINFGKRDATGGFRNFKMGMNDFFVFCIGDNGNSNNNTNTWNPQMGVWYNAPSSSFAIGPSGKVVMQYDYGTSSDERVKTNIKIIENALEKTLLLRGVEYNDFRIESDRKRIGLITQEVELIIPEVVGEGETEKIKNISYGPIVGLLIEAIEEQQKQIDELK
jgi:hypothetical protein